MAAAKSSAEDLEIGDQNFFLHDSTPEGTTQTTNSRRSSLKREEGSQIGMMLTGKQADQQETQSRRSSLVSKKSYRPPPTVVGGLMAFAKASWINLLVIFIPFGIASHFVWSSTVTFILNFIAIIPLAKLLGFVTEEVALYTGEVGVEHFEIIYDGGWHKTK